MGPDGPRIAVVGHAEWVTFLRVGAVPASGEIAHAVEVREEPGGSGAVAAAELARLGAEPTLVVPLGNDAAAERIRARLESLGVRVTMQPRAEPHRRVTAMIDATGERTLVVHGGRMEPAGAPPLDGFDAVLVASGDAAAGRAARAAPLVVGMAQAGEALAGIDADALVASADSALERDTAAAVRARTLLVTRGAGGGTWRSAGLQQDWDAAPVPGPGGDAYGCGDAFAAALTLALARRDALPRAVAFAAAEAAAMRGRDGAVGP